MILKAFNRMPFECQVIFASLVAIYNQKNCDHEGFLCDVFYEGKDFFEIRYKLKFDRSEEELGK